MLVGIPRPRAHTEIIRHRAYYAIRNHLIEFLVRRSKELAAGPRDAPATATAPRIVNPALDAAALASADA